MRTYNVETTKMDITHFVLALFPVSTANHFITYTGSPSSDKELRGKTGNEDTYISSKITLFVLKTSSWLVFAFYQPQILLHTTLTAGLQCWHYACISLAVT